MHEHDGFKDAILIRWRTFHAGIFGRPAIIAVAIVTAFALWRMW